MCDNCRTLDKYGAALSALHHGLVKVLRKPGTFTGQASALASTFGAMALSAHPEREAQGMVDFIDHLTPDERREARDVSDTLAMLYQGNARIINTAMRAAKEAGAWDDDDHSTCADDEPGTTEREGRILMGMPRDGAQTPETIEKVKAILAEAARKIAEMTGAPVEMQELHTDGGHVRPGNRTVTTPGQLPIIGSRGPQIVH